MKRTWIKVVCAVIFIALVSVGILTVMHADSLLHEQLGEDTESILATVNILLFELGVDSLAVTEGKSPSTLFYLEVFFVLLFIAFCVIFGWLLKNKAVILSTKK